MSVDERDFGALWSLNNLSVRFGDRTLVGPLSMDLHAGRLHALVGESGSGKTLTLRALAAALPQGLVSSGIPFVAPSRAMIFQDPASFFNPRWRVERSIREVLVHVQGVQRRACEDALLRLAEEVGLERAELERYPFQLSGGMVQRAAIAMALAADARVILADEMTSALDPERAASILALLRGRARERGCAVVFASHDLRLVAATADEVSVLYAGRLIERLPADELLERPRHRYTAALVAALPSARLRGTALPELPRDVSASRGSGAAASGGTASGGTREGASDADPGCPFRWRCPAATAACERMPDWDPDGRVRCHHPEPTGA